MLKTKTFTNRAIRNLINAYISGDLNTRDFFRILERSNITIKYKHYLILKKFIGMQRPINIKGI